MSALPIDLFADTAAILISIVSTTYYGMPRGQIHINLPPEDPIMSFETIEIKMAAVSVKRSIELLSQLRARYFLWARKWTRQWYGEETMY